jgi:hypothetical protein
VEDGQIGVGLLGVEQGDDIGDRQHRPA